jgi:RND family efflux transporter MFP subunit
LFTPLALIATALLLTACEKQAPPQETEAPVRPVKSVVVTSGGASGLRTFPGRVDASRQVELSFSVAGKIEELPAREGAAVKEGTVVAKLDPTDFQNEVNDQQARYDKANSEFDRAKELIKKNFISRQDFDALEATLKSAAATLARAKTDLGYTVLKAPFSGRIAQRYVENFTEVQAKERIMAVQDVETLEVKVDVPENVIRLVRRSDSDGKRVPVAVRFDGGGEKSFPLTFKEAATRADAQTQTFEVTFTLPAPTEVNLLPGMTVSVDVDLSKIQNTEGHFALPVSAVVGDIEKDPTVWVVNEESMTVIPKVVQLGTMAGSSINVTGGLEPGERVVVAGVSFLREGMKVRLLEDKEQAIQ